MIRAISLWMWGNAVIYFTIIVEKNHWISYILWNIMALLITFFLYPEKNEEEAKE